MTKAKNWAIVVGVNAYKNIGRLEYANRDAEAMHNFFVKAKFDRVFWFADGITLPSSSEQNSTDPTSSDLVDFLHDRFSTKVPPLAPGDNCWFFFAGHGKRIDDCDYLLPIDYNPRLADHEKRAISVNFVRERLLKSGADNVILLLDACRTEGDRSEGIGIGEAQPGAITIFSCQRDRKAYEIEALQQGAFTWALLEALRMPGERNCATVERLDLYLRDRVPQICRQHDKPEQVPMTLVEPRQKSYLILLPQFATEKDIVALKSQAQGAELAENFELAEQLWFRYGAISGDLEAFDGYARVQRKKENKRLTDRSERLSGQGFGRSGRTQEPPTFSFHYVTLDVTGKRTARKPGQASYFSEDLGNGITLDMVKISGSTFKMGAATRTRTTTKIVRGGLFGLQEKQKKETKSIETEESSSSDEFPQHEVIVKDFWIGKFVVTQEQWKSIAHPSNKVKIKLELDPSNWKGNKLPVEKVSWDEAKEFCDRLSTKIGKTFDLPTEVQWEYACRAGTTTPFHFGETITTDVANFDGNYTCRNTLKGSYREKTIAVDSFDPNAFGLYNMHGNVWEWCLDPWHSNYNGAPKDDRVWDTSNNSESKSRLMRGGSWNTMPTNCRSANRFRNASVYKDDDVGFRVVCLSSRGLS